MGIFKKLGSFISSLEKEEISKPLWDEMNMNLMKSYGVLDGMTLFMFFADLINGERPSTINDLLLKLNKPFREDVLAGQLVFAKFVTTMFEMSERNQLPQNQMEILRMNHSAIVAIFVRAKSNLKTG